MNENFKPTALKQDKNGKSFLPIYIEDYETLARFASSAIANVNLITNLLLDDMDRAKAYDVGYALESVGKVLKEVDWSMSEAFELMEHINKGKLRLVKQ